MILIPAIYKLRIWAHCRIGQISQHGFSDLTVCRSPILIYMSSCLIHYTRFNINELPGAPSNIAMPFLWPPYQLDKVFSYMPLMSLQLHVILDWSLLQWKRRFQRLCDNFASFSSIICSSSSLSAGFPFIEGIAGFESSISWSPSNQSTNPFCHRYTTSFCQINSIASDDLHGAISIMITSGLNLFLCWFI